MFAQYKIYIGVWMINTEEKKQKWDISESVKSVDICC